MRKFFRSTLSYVVLAVTSYTSLPGWITSSAASAQDAPAKPQLASAKSSDKSGSKARDASQRIKELQSYVAELQKTRQTLRDRASISLLDGILKASRCELLHLRIATGPGTVAEKSDLIAQLDQSCPQTPPAAAVPLPLPNVIQVNRLAQTKAVQFDPTLCRSILHHDLNAASYLPQPAQAPASCTAVDCRGTTDLRNRAASKKSKIGKREKAIEATTIQDVGREESGPGNVQLKYGNRLRFALSLGVKSTSTDAPKIPGILSVANVGGNASVAGAAANLSANAATKSPDFLIHGDTADVIAKQKTPAEQFDDKWNSYSDCYATLVDQAQQVEGSINRAIDSTNEATARYTAVLSAYSQPVLPAGDIRAMQSRVQDPAIFSGYYHYAWPDRSLQSVLDDLKAYQLMYALLPSLDGYGAWIQDDGKKQAFNYINANVPQLITELNGLGSSADSASKLRDAQAAAENWQERFKLVESLKLDDFIVSRDVPCNTWFGSSQASDVKLAYRDLTDPKATTDTTSDLLTVNCHTNITISTGVGFTTLGDRKPDFVPNPTDTTKQQLGYTSNSAVRPLFALQTNFSLMSWNDSGFEIHGTLGAALNASNDSSATLGFLFGPSFSFRRRTFFITPALHMGQESVFQTGFKPGDPKGSLTSPPTVTRWKPSFALTVTFPTSK